MGTMSNVLAQNIDYQFMIEYATKAPSGHNTQPWLYGAQNEAYRMMEGRKVGKVVSLQRVMRSLTVEAPQNETFTLV